MKDKRASESFGQLPVIICFTCCKVVKDAFEGSKLGRHKAFCEHCREDGTAKRTIEMFKTLSNSPS